MKVYGEGELYLHSLLISALAARIDSTQHTPPPKEKLQILIE